MNPFDIVVHAPKKIKIKKKGKKRIVDPNTHLLFHFYLLNGQFSSIRNIITSNKLVGGFVTLMLRETAPLQIESSWNFYMLNNIITFYKINFLRILSLGYILSLFLIYAH